MTYSATSQSFNNIPDLWTIDGRTKSPSSQKSTSPTGHETPNKSLGEGKGVQNKDNTDNNNMIQDKTSSNLSIDSTTIFPRTEKSPEVEEAIDVLQDLDNWTD